MGRGWESQAGTLAVPGWVPGRLWGGVLDSYGLGRGGETGDQWLFF
jgi:hypothetical protein